MLKYSVSVEIATFRKNEMCFSPSLSVCVFHFEYAVDQNRLLQIIMIEFGLKPNNFHNTLPFTCEYI